MYCASTILTVIRDDIELLGHVYSTQWPNIIYLIEFSLHIYIVSFLLFSSSFFIYFSNFLHRDWHCPVCLQTASFPVQTNCGHLFCAPCLIAYWRHGSWLDAISCPLCRQKVSALCHLFNESRSDRQSKEVLGEITDYNRRYSGAPRRVTDYLCDAPLLLQLLARGLSTIGGLVWLFFFRVALCCVGTVVSISSPPLDPVSTSSAKYLLGMLCFMLLLAGSVCKVTAEQH
uniref:Si:dkey-183n20.15 n=1 Tax=Scophthalmus maximus TaxID=52904 RepID=A0A8D3DDJ1_SCOMX